MRPRRPRNQSTRRSPKKTSFPGGKIVKECYKKTAGPVFGGSGDAENRVSETLGIALTTLSFNHMNLCFYFLYRIIFFSPEKGARNRVAHNAIE